MTLTHVSLFTGIGGIDIAAGWAGFETVCFVENNDYCQKVLKKHWPETPIIGDIRDVTKETLANTTKLRGGGEFGDNQNQGGEIQERGQEINARDKSIGRGDGMGGGGTNRDSPITLITGGFPCQPVSTAGKQRGKEDDRWLWPEMLRVISEVRPTWVVAENVAGLIRMGLNDCISDLEGEGFEVQTFLIPACAINAPHRRGRIFIVAHSIDSEHRGGRGQAGEEDSIQGVDRETLGSRGASRGSQDVANTTQQSTSRADNQNISRQEQGQLRGNSRQSREFNQWAVEPDVGRSLDGFSSWLDRFDFIIPHMLYLTYGKKEKRRTEEILSALRGEVEAEVIRQCAGGQHGICEAEILFTYLCKFQETSNSLGNISLESAEIQERLLRGLQWYYKFTGTPYRPDSIEQFTGEHTDSLQTLSRFLAHHSQAAWQAYCWSDACLNPWDNTWELGIERVAHGISSRVDRLKALGNAVVPAQIYPILKAIADIEMMRGADAD